MDTATGVIDSGLENLAKGVAKAVGDAVKDLATLWTKVPVAGLGDGEVASKVQENLTWYAMAFAIIGLMIAGAQMAIQGRGQPAREALQSLVTLVLITGASIPLAKLAISAGDGFADYMLGEKASTGFSERMGTLLIGVTSGTGVMAPFVVIIGGLLLLLASMAQIAFLLIRSAVLVLLVGVLPLAAAATNTSVGRQWFQKIVGWCFAFVLYKPAAALIYAVAFELFGESKGLVGMVMGLILMGLALIAMPALIRLCVPAAGAVVGSAAGGGALAGMMGTAMIMGRSGGSGPTGAASTGSEGRSASPAAPTGSGNSPSGEQGTRTSTANSRGADTGSGTSAAGATGGKTATASAAGGATAAAGPTGVAAAAALQAGQSAAKGAKDAIGGDQ